jgi:hypothetical protein
VIARAGRRPVSHLQSEEREPERRSCLPKLGVQRRQRKAPALCELQIRRVVDCLRETFGELRRQAALSNAEQHELDELLKLYPDLPKPPENPVTRAMLDYVEKCDREEAERMAARRASMMQA